jgi:hypothetical protein
MRGDTVEERRRRRRRGGVAAARCKTAIMMPCQ